MKLRVVLKLLLQLFQYNQYENTNNSIGVINPVSMAIKHLLSVIEKFPDRAVSKETSAVTFNAKYLPNLAESDWYRFWKEYIWTNSKTGKANV